MIGGDAVQGSYYSNHYSFEETRPEIKDFVANYKQRYGVIPDALAALGYDAANVVVPVGSDFYYEVRPTIALPRPDPANPNAAWTAAKIC